MFEGIRRKLRENATVFQDQFLTYDNARSLALFLGLNKKLFETE